ncbi:MAG: Ig-like domain-containing protein [Proteobacteria bacterium]|nr:Ig-like domain-containing protein [Pseudomonadota bacterium]
MELGDSDPNMVKVLLLTSNFPGSDALHSEITQIYDQTRDWNQVAAVVNNFMNQLVAQYETGVSGVAQAIFDNGFGIKLSITQVEQLVVDFIRQGIDSWSGFFEFVITDTGGELGKALDGHVEELDAPKLLTSLPSDDATQVKIDSNVVLTFDENVMAGVGDIIISDGQGDNRVIAVTDTSQVTFNGNTVTIDPAKNLIFGRTYNVQMASGVIADLENHPYAGITDATALNFGTVPQPQVIPSGATFVLTPDTDNITGTSGNDSIIGLLVDGDEGQLQTIQTEDHIDGGAGTDSAVLEIINSSTVAPTITNVEVMDITVLSSENSALDMSHIDGVRSITVEDNGSASFSLTNVGEVIDLGVRNIGTFTIDYSHDVLAGARDVMNLSLIGTESSLTHRSLTINGSEGETLERLNIAASGAAEYIALGGSALGSTDTLVITGTAGLSLSIITGLLNGTTSSGNALVDASAATGNNRLDLSAITNNLSVTGGSGNDEIISGSGIDEISGGAGADTFSFGADSSGLALGAIDIVTDFATGIDRLDFGGGAGNSSNFKDAGQVADYAAALAEANGIMQQSEGVRYVFADNGIDGWVFVDNNSNPSQLQPADLSIQLSGVTTIGATDIVAPIIQ